MVVRNKMNKKVQTCVQVWREVVTHSWEREIKRDGHGTVLCVVFVLYSMCMYMFHSLKLSSLSVSLHSLHVWCAFVCKCVFVCSIRVIVEKKKSQLKQEERSVRVWDHENIDIYMQAQNLFWHPASRMPTYTYKFDPRFCDTSFFLLHT